MPRSAAGLERSLRTGKKYAGRRSAVNRAVNRLGRSLAPQACCGIRPAWQCSIVDFHRSPEHSRIGEIASAAEIDHQAAHGAAPLELVLTSLLNGLSYGLLLFMLTAGLTLVFSLMGVLNFAHASLYMLGAYYAFQLSQWLGFWPALLLAPLAVGVTGALLQRFLLRPVHARGQTAELIVTFGVAWLIGEIVHLAWGRAAVEFRLPAELSGAAFTFFGAPFPAARAFVMLVAVAMLVVLWLAVTRTRAGLLVRAALEGPRMLEALGHDVPRLQTLVFAGGAALAGLAGALGGATFVTEPGMAATVGSIIFVVVVVGGMGSLTGAFIASLAIGLLQTFAVAIEVSLQDLLLAIGLPPATGALAAGLRHITLAQAAPALPYLLMVLVLVLRPSGLMGTRTD